MFVCYFMTFKMMWGQRRLHLQATETGVCVSYCMFVQLSPLFLFDGYVRVVCECMRTGDSSVGRGTRSLDMVM